MLLASDRIDGGNQSEDNAKTHLKLLPEPIYRYQELPRDVLDGAMFAFAIDDDPECVLILEARIIEKKPQWFYAFGSQTSRPVDCKLDNRRVWSNDTPAVAVGAPNGEATKPDRLMSIAALRLPIRAP